MLELGLTTGIIISVLAFFFQYMDASLGMGYGTTLAPLLLLLGFEPLEVVPAVLLSQLFAGIAASFFHHRLRNVNFSWGEQDLEEMFTFAICGVVGAIGAVFVALRLPPLFLKIYIGGLVTAIGIFILATLNRHFSFSWWKIIGFGLIASFNKGISGGGYGPLVTGGQILSGVEAKRAVGITTLSEALVTTVAVVSYFILRNSSDWKLAPYLVVGALLSTPLSALTVRQIKTKTLRIYVGSLTLVLGVSTLVKILL